MIHQADGNGGQSISDTGRRSKKRGARGEPVVNGPAAALQMSVPICQVQAK